MYSYYNRSRHASNACLNFQARAVGAGGGGGHALPPILADLLTLSQVTRGADYARLITTAPSLGFSDPPTALQATVLPTRTHLRILKGLNWTQIGPTTSFGSLFFYVFGEGRFMVSLVWSFTFLAKGCTTYDFVMYVTCLDFLRFCSFGL